MRPPRHLRARSTVSIAPTNRRRPRPFQRSIRHSFRSPTAHARARQKEIRTKVLIFHESESKKQEITGWRSRIGDDFPASVACGQTEPAYMGSPYVPINGPTVRGAPGAHSNSAKVAFVGCLRPAAPVVRVQKRKRQTGNPRRRQLLHSLRLAAARHRCGNGRRWAHR